MKLFKEKEYKDIENQGFSLVELMVVIAAILLLTAIMIPRILGYVERTKVTSDTQLAENVRTAVRIAMADPAVLNDLDSEEEIADIVMRNNSKNNALALSSLADSTTAFAGAIAETLDVTVAELALIDAKLRSDSSGDGAMEIRFWIMNESDAGVVIVNSDDGSGKEIVIE